MLVRTKETLATGHFMSVINILMQLRKVCNHPDLFDPRPTVSPFRMEGVFFTTASLVLHALDQDPVKVGPNDLTTVIAVVNNREMKVPDAKSSLVPPSFGAGTCPVLRPSGSAHYATPI